MDKIPATDGLFPVGKLGALVKHQISFASQNAGRQSPVLQGTWGLLLQLQSRYELQK